jgi:hypothetical protein
MSQPRIKNRLESNELSTNPKPIQERLNACLASDPAHIQPRDHGDHVKVIQTALNIVRRRNPDIGLIEIKDPPGTWGDDTTNAVVVFKAFHSIIRTGQKLDPIVGRMTITQLDEDLLHPPAPRPTPPPATKLDIKTAADNIKKELAGDDDRDLEFLARLFEDDNIIDSGPGNELQSRLETILGASSDGSNNGVTHFAGIYAGVTDLGFRTAFKDPFPGKSDNQVGHFTTGVDMGFRPQRTFSVMPKVVQDLVNGDSTPTAFPKDEIICVRLIVGHEQVADNATLAFLRQAESPTNKEILQFFTALQTVNENPNQTISISAGALIGIRIGSGQGNSFQDLHLSLFGFKFGTMIRQARITTRTAAALWIRTNIGKFLPNPVPPGPPMG